MRRADGMESDLGMTVPVAILLLIFLVPAGLHAQVGHPPGRSPYRDIPKGHAITPYGALFGGTGGRFAIATSRRHVDSAASRLSVPPASHCPVQ